MNEVLALLFIALMSRTAFAISCYSCESTYESKCGEDNFEAENYFKLDCEDLVPPRYLENELEILNSTACMKKIYLENGERKIVRSCFFGDMNATMTSCSRDPTLESVEEISCDVCDNKSLCNGADERIKYHTKHYGITLAFFVVTKLFGCLK